MISDKPSIGRLVQIARQKGVRNVVISPGSRNAPLIISFDNDPFFQCFNIPDERVAAFFALGLSVRLNEPVILSCTSGSAVLNYAPAIAEAYYQKIPLIVITADRPVEWIDQRAGQTMRQKDVFHNYIQSSYELIEEPVSEDHLWYNDRIINEAFDVAAILRRGPVHINIPLKEPLYDEIDRLKEAPKLIRTLASKKELSEKDAQDLASAFYSHQKIMILCGQHQPDADFQKAITELADMTQLIMLSETTTNVYSPNIITCIDRSIDDMSDEEIESYTPTLLISCGVSIISKKIRYLLRRMKIDEHWHVDPDDHFIDTYKALTLNVPQTLAQVFHIIKKYNTYKSDNESNYAQLWRSRSDIRRTKHLSFAKVAPWSDWYAVHRTLTLMPRPGVVHMANSTSVRYVQLFDSDPDIVYQCNRGVSGIDGCSSTAVGYAHASEYVNTLVTGDVAFFYDSNALWHSHVPNNLRIVLLNNEGGNIFRVIPGPDKTKQLERHFESHHNTSAEQLAAAYGIEYLRASDKEGLEEALKKLYSKENYRPMILEVFTPRFENDKVLKDYFKAINKR